MASTSATANNVSGENHISQMLSSVGRTWEFSRKIPRGEC